MKVEVCEIYGAIDILVNNVGISVLPASLRSGKYLPGVMLGCGQTIPRLSVGSTVGSV